MRWLTLICFLFAATTVSAKDLKIGIVDMQKLFNSYPGTQTAKAKLKKLEQKKMDDLQDSAQELKDLQSSLGSSLLSDKQKAKKQKEFNDKKTVFEQEQAQAQKELVDRENEMTQNIIGELKDIVAGVAKDKGIDLVLDSDKTVYAKDATDLTDTVLKSFKDSTKNDKDSDSK